MDKRKKKFNQKMWSLILIAVCIISINFIVISTLTNSQLKANSETFTYQEFMKKAEKGEIEKVIIPSNVNKDIQIVMKDDKMAFTTNPDSPELRSSLVSLGVEVKTEKPSAFGGFFIQILIGITVLFIVMFIFRKIAEKKNGGAGGGIAQVKKDASKNLTDAKTNRYAKFEDLAVDEFTKESLWEVVRYLKDPAEFEKIGAKPSHGVLLCGPPGTGKTLLARAVAGEAGVPFYAATGASFNEMYVGVGASRVRELFAEARKNAPAIIFIDEIDSLGQKRNASSNGEAVQTVTELLAEMDGFKDNKGIVVIATTNRKDSLDEAVIRSGRFSKHIEVGLPDIEEREAILKIHAKNKKISKELNFPRLAKLTVGFSGADLEHLMNESALFALRRKGEEVTWEDTQDAFELILLGSKKKKNTWSEFENKVVAYHEVGHALASLYISKEVFERITVNPAGDAGGYVLRAPKNNKLSTRKNLYNDICVAMAGRVAESIIFGEENVTTGAQQDFRQASQTALKMVFAYGMSDMGVIAVPNLDENMWHTLSPDVRNKAQEEMSRILKEAETEVRQLLTEKKDEFESLTQRIMEVKTMDGEDVVKFLEGTLVEEGNTGFPFLDNRVKNEVPTVALATVKTE